MTPESQSDFPAEPWNVPGQGPSERLRLFRAHRRLSRAQLAAQLGVHEKSIANWEQGIAEPGLRFALAIESLVGIPASDWISEVSHVS